MSIMHAQSQVLTSQELRKSKHGSLANKRKPTDSCHGLLIEFFFFFLAGVSSEPMP
jgi:hypothetical protein